MNCEGSQPHDCLDANAASSWHFFACVGCTGESPVSPDETLPPPSLSGQNKKKEDKERELRDLGVAGVSGRHRR